MTNDKATVRDVEERQHPAVQASRPDPEQDQTKEGISADRGMNSDKWRPKDPLLIDRHQNVFRLLPRWQRPLGLVGGICLYGVVLAANGENGGEDKR